MSEDYRMYYKYMDAFKQKHSKGSYNEEQIKNVYLEAFSQGKQVGFDLGYNKGIKDIDAFEFDDGSQDSSEEVQTDVDKSDSVFDPAYEILNY